MGGAGGERAQRRRHSLLPSSPVQFSSVTQLCLILCNPMNRRTPGLPVHHQLPEFTKELMLLNCGVGDSHCS